MGAIEDYLKKVQPLVDKEMEKVFPRQIGKKWLEYALDKADFAYDEETITKSAAEPIWDLLDRGGKRLRPALTILSCEAVGGKKELALKMSPLVELVHNGCVTGDTLIWTAEGIPKKITDIKQGDKVLSLDNDFSIVERPVEKIHENGIKKVLLIKATNRELKATENHPFLVASKKQPARYALTQKGRINLEARLAHLDYTISDFCEKTYPALGTSEFSLRHMKNALYCTASCLLPERIVKRISETLEIGIDGNWEKRQCLFEKADIVFEWKHANEIEIGDLLVITKEIAMEEGIFPELKCIPKAAKDKNIIPTEFSLELSQLCGFILGDGYIDVAGGRTGLCIPKNMPGRKEYEMLVENLFRHNPALDENQITCCSKAIASLFQNLGFAKHALEKEIPEWVFRLPKKHRLAFVKGYLDSDGTVTKEAQTTFECGSKKLIVQLKALLDSMGFVTGNVRSRTVDNSHFKRHVNKKTSELFALHLSSGERVLNEICTELQFYKERLAQTVQGRHIQFRQEEKIPSLPVGFSLQQLGFSSVRKIKELGEQQTFDIQIEGTHNYFSNGIVTHNTLISDDAEDCSETRRGKKCTYLLFGLDTAINDGAAMYFIPLTLLYRNPYKLKEKTIRKIYDLYSQEMLRVSMGQAMDIYWHRGQKSDISEQEYLQMCVYKTGVLTRFSTKLGAILGNAKPAQEKALGKFGETIGVAFQIQDDILNLVGEEFQKGKGVGEDIHEGKRTIMVLHALQYAEESEKQRLLEILNAHPTEQETINEAIAIIKKNNSIEYAREKAKSLVKQAWKKLNPVLKESPAKKTLKEFADYLIERKI
ncbi:MAG TPA: polyprenyl synthetase family protein [archaeon]|nr:polyprenyl synthetase family protein [archaeon]